MVSMTIRLPRQLRDAANTKADERDEYLSEAIREFLQWYIDKDARIEYEQNESPLDEANFRRILAETAKTMPEGIA
jgi:Arc/MetJ-type ribon-helix-helix transcriptional regulator